MRRALREGTSPLLHGHEHTDLLSTLPASLPGVGGMAPVATFPQRHLLAHEHLDTYKHVAGSKSLGAHSH